MAGPVFITTFLATGAVRDDYDPMRHPVSSLALGPAGWVQQANFCLNGILYLAFAAGLVRTQDRHCPPLPGILLVAAAGAGQIGAGIFTTDPVSGYPPGTAPVLAGYSGTEALIHDLAAVPVFVGIPAAALIWARAFARHRCRRWARYSGATAVIMLAGFALTSAAFAQAPALAPVGGLLQRLTVGTGMTWLSALAMRYQIATSTSTGS
ncbi:DUF998 domain-containing protein [Kocuria sabuli]|uniref:DUF998 domain-containing protein n=1 Tax=Kocuria sabuli TaxID=3071448 RepID=UPI0034D5A445